MSTSNGPQLHTPRAWRFWTKIIIAVGVFAATATTALWPARSLDARESAPSTAKALSTVAEADLPKEAKATLALIAKGGPFPYSKDGTTFSNRERILPKQARNHYREYTVKTPGARTRGARRIVCGGTANADAATRECYYTDDHYASFRRIK
jgi:ribonuclease T1